MKKNEQDPIDELFLKRFKELELEVNDDLLSGVQSRIRFDQYLKIFLKTLSISTLVVAPILIYIYTNKTSDIISKPDLVHLDNVLLKQMDNTSINLETIKFQIMPVMTKNMEVQHSDLLSEKTILQQKEIISDESEKKPYAPVVSEGEKQKGIEVNKNKVGYVKARPIKGFEHLYKNIASKLVYPDTLREERITGTVHVKFTIDKYGSVQNVSVVSGIHHLLDVEAVRVVNLMPKWHPATLNGRPVQSQLTIPIKFNIEDNMED